MRTVYFESSCYCKATKYGSKILGRVTRPLLPPARVQAAQPGPALSCLGATVRKAAHGPPPPPTFVAPPLPPAQEAFGFTNWEASLWPLQRFAPWNEIRTALWNRIVITTTATITALGNTASSSSYSPFVYSARTYYSQACSALVEKRIFGDTW